MNKLSDLNEHWQPDEKIIDAMMQKEQPSNGTLPLTQKEKDLIFQNVLKKANIPEQTIASTSESKKIRLKKRRLLPAILVAILAMVTLSFAAVTTIIDPAFLTYLKPSYQEQIDAIKNSTILLGQEDSDNGYTVRARQAIGDKNTVYVLFDLIKEDETVLDLPCYAFSSYDVTLKNNFTPFHLGMGGIGYSISEMEDENTTDPVRTFLLELNSNQSLLKKKLDVRFENICTYHATEPCEETLVNGNWELSIPLDYQDASITTHPMKKIPLSNSKSTAWVTSLRISPISITISANGKGVSLYDSSYEAQSSCPENEEIEVTLKDGSKVDYNSSGTHCNGITFSKDQSFSKIIDLREIESVRYLEIEFWN